MTFESHLEKYALEVGKGGEGCGGRGGEGCGGRWLPEWEAEGYKSSSRQNRVVFHLAHEVRFCFKITQQNHR